MRPGERAEATATRGGHGTALKPRVHAEAAGTIAAATMVAAVEAIRAFALPRRSPAKRLPDDVLRYVASFVGSLPDVDEAVRLNRPALRAILARRLRKHVSPAWRKVVASRKEGRRTNMRSWKQARRECVPPRRCGVSRRALL